MLAKRVEILVEFQSNAKFIVLLSIKELMLNQKQNLGEYCKEFILESTTFFL